MKSLNKDEIYEYQQNREPYLMIDFVTEVVPGESAKGYKDLNKEEWFFKVHWPKDPNMPGMLQIESLVQMASISILTLPHNKGKVMYLISANNLKFIKKILPGERLNIETRVKSFKRGIASFEGKGFVDKEMVCKADFNLILPEEIKKYTLKKS
jgi:3-hydroxyacyl-[acyl-carrier-protein] dehydratase|tara:strand:+ start:4224 stop:4685 length:462 start_codon:yes stop_codon:yes gene_type:complete